MGRPSYNRANANGVIKVGRFKLTQNQRGPHKRGPHIRVVKTGSAVSVGFTAALKTRIVVFKVEEVLSVQIYF